MTTPKETREAFECLALENGCEPEDLLMNSAGAYVDAETNFGWFCYQAALSHTEQGSDRMRQHRWHAELDYLDVEGWSVWERLLDNRERLVAHSLDELDAKRIAAAALSSLPEQAGKSELPERDTAKPAEEQGLFRKFEVRRVDGSDGPGGKHEGCEYFVLDMDHDQHAPAALIAYAHACKDTHPQLSAELMEQFGKPAEPSEKVRRAEDLLRWAASLIRMRNKNAAILPKIDEFLSDTPAQPSSAKVLREADCACLEFWESHHPDCPTTERGQLLLKLAAAQNAFREIVALKDKYPYSGWHAVTWEMFHIARNADAALQHTSGKGEGK